MLETRPDLLRKVALASKVLGVVLLIIGVIAFIAGLTAGGNMPAIVTSLVKVAALLILLTGIFFFIILYAVGDMVLVLLGIAENTRSMQERIASGAVAQATPPPGSGSGRATHSASPEATVPSSSASARAERTSTESGSADKPDEVMRRATEQAKRAAEIARKTSEQNSERK